MFYPPGIAYRIAAWEHSGTAYQSRSWSDALGGEVLRAESDSMSTTVNQRLSSLFKTVFLHTDCALLITQTYYGISLKHDIVYYT